MFKRLALIILIFICFFPSSLFAKKPVTVVILPFEIHSSDDYSNLQTSIPEVLKKHLKQDGVSVPDVDKQKGLSPENTAKSNNQIRNLGIKNEADYIIWGSMAWIGKQFSLDIKMLEVFGTGPPIVFSTEGKGIENLPHAVKKLAGDISLKLFKREIIIKIIIKGNKRIEADAIKRVIITAPGDVFIPKNLSNDLKTVYSMGYFEDVRIEAESTSKGKIIFFKVKEKPTIRKIILKGNSSRFEDEKIKENLNIKTGSILNIFKVQKNVKRIEALYKEKNYHNVKVDYKTVELKNNQADLTFIIEEGEKVRIKTIKFIGNKAYTEKKLKKILKSSERGFFSWLTSSGDLTREDLNEDIARLAEFYHNNGYIQAKIGEPKVEFKENHIEVTIKIKEGVQFKVGKVYIKGDLVVAKEILLERIKISNQEYFNRRIVQNDVILLKDIYSDEGYAYTEIFPRTEKDFDKLVVNITFDIKKGKQVYFEEIIISGNTKTRDKVIRRQLKVYEQELFSGIRLKRSIRNLYRLDYFQDVKVNTLKGSADDKMVLKIDITEKPTGTFSFGGGYSTYEKVFLTASISQKNLFGRGQILDMTGKFGDVTKKYSLGFTEPWLFDIPLSASIKLYDWEYEYDAYDKRSRGGILKLGYPLFDYTRGYISFTYDKADIEITDEAETPQSIVDLVEDVGDEDILAKSIIAELRYDSRNRIFNATKGSDHSMIVEYAGFDGDIGFTKYTANTGWYIPLFKDLVGLVHAKGGYVRENPDGKLPDYERFFLGGINSLRGFDWEDLAPKDEDGNSIGGDKFVQFNIELLMPLFKDAGIVGVIFFDTGDVYEKDEDINLGELRESAGFGFRWYSPVGPIRLEYGYILDPIEGQGEGGQWEFTMGGAF
ncbi:MAG: outer membrane protein assembly factor BamA [Deltaproteobacteria bacterium]|nr:outer membrane protein assembly factor BamA [Deltaproteobacteria bacterium]MBW1848507.1 outer membrane protein assembly factor BamA [Deltaproteobacteria bacterium]